MKPVPIAVPAICAQRISPEVATRIVGVGKIELLNEPLLGLISSRECPGHILLETLERVPEWVKAGRVIASGFHSPLEQQVLRSLLRRKGRAVKVLARGFGDESTDYQPAPEEGEAFTSGCMLVISAFTSDVRRISRATALIRNRLVLALATETVVPHIAAASPLKELISAYRQKPIQQQSNEH